MNQLAPSERFVFFGGVFFANLSEFLLVSKQNFFFKNGSFCVREICAKISREPASSTQSGWGRATVTEERRNYDGSSEKDESLSVENEIANSYLSRVALIDPFELDILGSAP